MEIKGGDMIHYHDTQIGFTFQEKRIITVNFRGGQITTDAGLLPIREYDHRVGFTEKITQLITDHRTPYLIRHQLLDLVRQRLYGIIAGYEDANDADFLRHDPVMLTITNRRLDNPLGSQPTICRMENKVLAREIISLNKFLLNHYLSRQRRCPRKRLILDVDSTDDPAHGKQQLALFNGFYDQHMYYPLLFFDGETADLLGIRLRPGNVHGAHRLTKECERIVTELRKRFPKTQIILRSDAAAAGSSIYLKLEALKIDYLISLSINQVLRRRVAKFITRVEHCYRKTKKKVCHYTSFWHRAKSWQKRRRVLVKVEYGFEGLNLRLVVTSLRRGKARDLFDLYEDRSKSENWIKELKNGLFCDRLSCSSYIANAFRLLLHSLAYVLIHNFRFDVLKKTELARATIETIRLKLIKVGALVRVTTRRIWFYLSESWPFRGIYWQVVRRLRFDTT